MVAHGMVDASKASEANTWRIQTRKEKGPEKVLIDEKTKKLRAELQKEAANKEEDPELSSGLESDNDLDLLVEQEVLQAMRMRKELRKRL